MKKALEVMGFCLFVFGVIMIMGFLCIKANNHCNSFAKDYWEKRKCIGI